MDVNEDAFTKDTFQDRFFSAILFFGAVVISISIFMSLALLTSRIFEYFSTSIFDQTSNFEDHTDSNSTIQKEEQSKQYTAAPF